MEILIIALILVAIYWIPRMIASKQAEEKNGPAFTEEEWSEAVCDWYEAEFDSDFEMGLVGKPGWTIWEPPPYEEVKHNPRALERLRVMSGKATQDIDPAPSRKAANQYRLTDPASVAGSFDPIITKVVGVTYSGRQRIVRSLREGESLVILPEPDNPHDPHAVKVITESGQQVGYINRQMAQGIAAFFSAPEFKASAKVLKIIGIERKGQSLGVIIQIDPPSIGDDFVSSEYQSPAVPNDLDEDPECDSGDFPIRRSIHTDELSRVSTEKPSKNGTDSSGQVIQSYKCPLCGKRNRVHEDECSFCGRLLGVAALKELRVRCPTCGEEVLAGSKYCCFCMEPLPSMVSQKRSAAHGEVSKTKPDGTEEPLRDPDAPEFQDPFRVLIVDDVQETREWIRKTLEKVGDIIVVGEATTGVEGIERYAELRPDVVCTNICMPVMDGIEMTKEIRDRFPEAQIFILSVQSSIKNMREAFLAGARDFIAKPPADHQLTDAVLRLGSKYRERLRGKSEGKES